MAIDIKTLNQLISFAERTGCVVHTKREDYYYVPFFIRIAPDHSKQLVPFDELPEEVKQFIKNETPKD